MAARSRGNGTNFDWRRKSCDISTCDLSPDGNPEKYGSPMKSAIGLRCSRCRRDAATLMKISWRCHYVNFEQMKTIAHEDSYTLLLRPRCFYCASTTLLPFLLRFVCFDQTFES